MNRKLGISSGIEIHMDKKKIVLREFVFCPYEEGKDEKK